MTRAISRPPFFELLEKIQVHWPVLKLAVSGKLNFKMRKRGRIAGVIKLRFVVLVVMSFTNIIFGQSSLQSIPQAVPTNTSKENGRDSETRQRLLAAKRAYVESFGDDTINKTLQAMIVDAIGGSKRFIVTENKEKADLLLKGAALEKSTTESHSLASATTVGSASGSALGFAAEKVGIADSQSSVETVNDARVSVRLVAKDGDVMWSTTQESQGAKFKGATADVADKVVKQLMRDLAKLVP